MSARDGLQLVERSPHDAVDACDRCLALSRLTWILSAVPVLRGTPEHHARVAMQGGEELGADSAPDGSLRAPLARTSEGLAPTPGELVRAAAGVSHERAIDVARRNAGWSADAVRAECLALELAAVCACSTDYPESLRGLSDPPAVLYIAGDATLIDRCPEGAIGIVGTRRPTRVGREAARTIAMGIAQAGGLVVSGMALGIDGASHDGALAGHGPTIAVLAGGADRPTPPSHRGLYEAIVASGAVVSELPPGSEPSKRSFPARNRIIAALSEAVIVVEAPRKSGALITVDHAQDLGVDVFAVPGSLASPTCHGSNQLLCDGALGVVDGIDFMRARASSATRHDAGDHVEPEPLRPVDPHQSLVHSVLGEGRQTRQELARATGSSLPPGLLEAALTDLELAGWVERGIDGRYGLARRGGA